MNTSPVAAPILNDEARQRVVELMKRLAAPFPERDVLWVMSEEDVVRLPNGNLQGRCFPHLDSRAVQRRLDETVPGQWASKLIPSSYGSPTANGGLLCELSVYFPGIGWVTRADGAELTATDPVKGGASGALKRAAVLFGIGRYLYELPPQYAVWVADGPNVIRADKRDHRWRPPLLPAASLPECDRAMREHELTELSCAALAPTVTTTPSSPSTEEVIPLLSDARLAELRGVLGDNDELSIAYLRDKGLVPDTAKQLREIRETAVVTLLEQAPRVRARMKALAPLATALAGKYQVGNAKFAENGFVAAGEPWFRIPADRIPDAEMFLAMTPLDEVRTAA